MIITSCLNAVRSLKIKLFSGVIRAVTVSFGPNYLFYTNVGISFTLSGVGDFLMQHYEISNGGQDVWDIKQTRNMSASGFSIGVLCHHWYKLLDKRLPGATVRTVIKKLLLDQTICSPISIGLIFITVGTIEGQPPNDTWNEIKQKFSILYRAEWIIWPPAQFINFYFLPTKYRIVYDNMISLGYDVYTSYIKNIYSVEASDEGDS